MTDIFDLVWSKEAQGCTCNMMIKAKKVQIASFQLERRTNEPTLVIVIDLWSNIKGIILQYL